MASISPLELLHPEGRVERVALLGERCPPELVPSTATVVDSDVGLALIAPSAAELRDNAWLEHAVESAARALAEDGLAYALLPGRRRSRAAALMRGEGLSVEPPLAHLESGGQLRYIVPMSHGPWHYAHERLISARPAARRMLFGTSVLPLGDSLLTRILPSAAIAGSRPGAPPLAAWVGGLGGQSREPRSVVLAASWRGPNGPVVLHCFDAEEASPWGVAKVSPAPSPEADVLSRIGELASAAGARVPAVLADGLLGERSAVVETVMPGVPAASVLMRTPRRFESVAEAVCGWLASWTQATARSAALDDRLLQSDLMGPAAEIADHLDQGDAYLDWLRGRCAALSGEGVPLVASHHDLTMWNVLTHERDGLGVLDWAEASPEGSLPLTDFFYAIGDAAAARDRYRDRLGALRVCFAASGAPTPTVQSLHRSLVDPLELAPATVELCFHACWLRHAANEQRAGGGGDGEFLEIARWLAASALGVAA